MKHGRGTYYIYIYIFNFAYVSLSLPYSFIVFSALLLFYNLENSFLKIDVLNFFACEVDNVSGKLCNDWTHNMIDTSIHFSSSSGVTGLLHSIPALRGQESTSCKGCQSNTETYAIIYAHIHTYHQLQNTR